MLIQHDYGHHDHRDPCFDHHGHRDHHNHTNDHDDNHLGCTGPLSTEPGTGVADEGGELLVEGQAGDQGQHLSQDHHRVEDDQDSDLLVDRRPR